MINYDSVHIVRVKFFIMTLESCEECLGNQKFIYQIITMSKMHYVLKYETLNFHCKIAKILNKKQIYLSIDNKITKINLIKIFFLILFAINVNLLNYM